MQKQDCEQSQYYQEDFLASHSVQPGSEEARMMTATSGRKCSELYRKSGQLGSLVRTLLDLYELRLMAFFPNCKMRDTKQGRTVLKLGMWGGLFKGERIAIVAASNYRCAAMRRYLQFSADGEAAGFWDHNGGRTQEPDLWERWKFEPRPYGVANGVPSRVDRLKCLGNAVVPQQFYPIFRAIADLEVSRWENTQSVGCGL